MNCTTSHSYNDLFTLSSQVPQRPAPPTGNDTDTHNEGVRSGNHGDKGGIRTGNHGDEGGIRTGNHGDEGGVRTGNHGDEGPSLPVEGDMEDGDVQLEDTSGEDETSSESEVNVEDDYSDSSDEDVHRDNVRNY